MLRARMAASVLATIVAAAVPAAPALATANSTRGGAAVRVRSDDADPCLQQNKVLCQQLPEAPNPYLYPAAGSAALILFVALERRRRKRSSRTQP